MVGKYNELQDAYKSIHESFVHGGALNECDVKVIPIHSEALEKGPEMVAKALENIDGVLVAPGFGERGIEGKLEAIKYVREHAIPFFGICLGMQCAVVEFARNVLDIKKASSTEVDVNAEDPIIDLMPDQKTITRKGGTMRLGSYVCNIKEGSIASRAYNSLKIEERHRHRYEFNNDYLEQIQSNGMLATGVNPETNLVEIVELENHPFFLGVQFHPELKSTVENPHPLFVSFIDACLKYSRRKAKNLKLVKD